MGRTLNLKQARAQPPGQIKDWLYNALDVTGTREVADTLLARFTEQTMLTYKFERALHNPAFSMMCFGVRIDVEKRKALVKDLQKEKDQYIARILTMPGVTDKWDGKTLDTGYCEAEPTKHHKWPKGVPDAERTCQRCGAPRVIPKPFEPGSDKQVSHLLYDLHKLPKQTDKKGKVTVNDDALERLGRRFPKVQHITESIREVRDRVKQLGSLNAKLTPDNRYMSSFNVGAAWTGRFSSSKNPYQIGGNLQNWAEKHRVCAIPDEGMEFGYADLKQAESNTVAHLSGDERYIEAHRIGDVHTYVTRLVWPDLGWTGDLKADKKIAKQLPDWDPVEGHDFRFQAKRIQHGSNYLLTPQGIAMIAHIPKKEAAAAQFQYFKEFPGIKAWQEREARAIREHQALVNVLGRRVVLFGRPWDPHTIKQGVAFKPQSSVADILNLAMLRIWQEMDPCQINLLAQVHDALLFQFPRGKYDIARKVARMMRIPIEIHGRVMTIEPELAVGMNWGHASESNPNGMKEIEL